MKIMKLGVSEIAVRNRLNTKKDVLNFVPWCSVHYINGHICSNVHVLLENDKEKKLDYKIYSKTYKKKEISNSMAAPIREQISKMGDIKGLIFQLETDGMRKIEKKEFFPLKNIDYKKLKEKVWQTIKCNDDISDINIFIIAQTLGVDYFAKED